MKRIGKIPVFNLICQRQFNGPVNCNYHEEPDQKYFMTLLNKHWECTQDPCRPHWMATFTTCGKRTRNTLAVRKSITWIIGCATRSRGSNASTTGCTNTHTSFTILAEIFDSRPHFLTFKTNLLYFTKSTNFWAYGPFKSKNGWKV